LEFLLRRLDSTRLEFGFLGRFASDAVEQLICCWLLQQSIIIIIITVASSSSSSSPSSSSLAVAAYSTVEHSHTTFLRLSLASKIGHGRNRKRKSAVVVVVVVFGGTVQ